MKTPLLFVALLSISIWSCKKSTPTISSDRTIASVMDSVMTRLYATVSPDKYNSLNDSFMLAFLTEEEKQALATRYQYFRVNVPVTVSLMRDQGQAVVPFWLESSGFHKTQMVVKNEEYTYEVWQKDFNAGMVELGINGFDKHRPVYFV